MDLEKRETELNQMILEGEALDAFERFYADDVVMQEGSDEPFRGKNTNRQREKDFFGAVTELRDLDLKETVVGDGVTMSIWHFDFTHGEYGEQKYDQVAVRRWNDDGEVVHERFFKA